MDEFRNLLGDAEAIARNVKRKEVERLVDECERQDDRTLRSLARAYRMLDPGR